jgi:hypothetical protein
MLFFLCEQDQLQQKDSLVSMYQEQCIQLNEEATKCKEQVDISKKMYRVSSYLFCFIPYNDGKLQSKPKSTCVLHLIFYIYS